MLLDDLKKQNLQAMKDHDADKRAILSVVISKAQVQQVEARASGKDFGDNDVLSIIQKVLKELSDEKAGYQQVGNLVRVGSISRQENVIKEYLPKQLSEEEIREEIAKLEDKSLPSVMKHFKINFAGRVDMALVSKIARG